MLCSLIQLLYVGYFIIEKIRSFSSGNSYKQDFVTDEPR